MKSKPIINASKLVKENTNFRLVMNTTEKDFQIVAMSLKPNENIGFEIHQDTSQMFYVLSGMGIAYIDGETVAINTGDIVVAERGESHDIINAGTKELKLLTVYSQQEHSKGKVQELKEEDR